MERPGSTGRFPPSRLPELLVTPGPAACVPHLVLREGARRGSWTGLWPWFSCWWPEPLLDTRVGRPNLGFTFGGLKSLGA